MAASRPQLVPTGVRRLPQFDAHVLSLYARGISVRDIQAHLEELYQVEVAPSVISAVTDEVMAEVTAWQQRPLDRVYPVVIFDALRLKIRDEGVVKNKAVYLALGVDRDGHKDVLGLWIEQTEGASFWLRVMTELKSRGVDDILIALVDGLVGLSRGDHHGVPRDAGAPLRRAPRAAEPGPGELEGAQSPRRRAPGDLPRAHGSRSDGDARRLRRRGVGHEVPRDRRPLAAALAVRRDRSSPSRPRFGSCSTRRTRSRACTCSSARS